MSLCVCDSWRGVTGLKSSKVRDLMMHHQLSILHSSCPSHKAPLYGPLLCFPFTAFSLPSPLFVSPSSILLSACQQSPSLVPVSPRQIPVSAVCVCVCAHERGRERGGRQVTMADRPLSCFSGYLIILEQWRRREQERCKLREDVTGPEREFASGK